MQAGNSFAESGLPTKLKTKIAFDGNDIILVKKKNVAGKDGLKVSPEHDCHAEGGLLSCYHAYMVGSMLLKFEILTIGAESICG
jgi:transcription initiation factor TFIID subunit 1